MTDIVAGTPQRAGAENAPDNAPCAVSTISPNAKGLSSLTSEEFHQVVLSTELGLSSFVSNIPALLQRNNVSVHDVVLTIDGKIRQGLAVLGENRRRIALCGGCNGLAASSVAVEIALKLIESQAEQMIKWNDELMVQWRDGKEARSWDERHQELVEFKRKHGHCNVLTSSGSLGNCVACNRKWYNGAPSYRHNPLTPDQIDQLNKLGFQWKAKRGRGRGNNGESWDERYQELVEFKRKHDHCNVPAKFGSLGTWVADNRARFNGVPSRRDNPLTPGQIDQLNQLGFQWKIGRGRPKKRKSRSH